jgi:hypothetical protein
MTLFWSTMKGGPSDVTGKNKDTCPTGCGMIKIPPCSKALSEEHKPKFCCPSPVPVMSQWECTTREQDNQSIMHFTILLKDMAILAVIRLQIYNERFWSFNCLFTWADTICFLNTHPSFLVLFCLFTVLRPAQEFFTIKIPPCSKALSAYDEIRITPHSWSWSWAHGGCDRSTGDAYSS